MDPDESARAGPRAELAVERRQVAEGDLLQCGHAGPVLLVDDPYSALDPTRRDRIASILAARPGQVVISVADEADVPAQATAILDVRAGSVVVRHEAA